MIVQKGKYNFALIMLPDESSLDETTKTQIYGFLNHPAFAKTHIAIMPDCHAGAGAVIGFTMKLNNYVIPNVVGVDIGCGVDAVLLDGVKEIDFEALDQAVHRIPHGFGRYPVQREPDAPFLRNSNILYENGLDCAIEGIADSIGLDSDDVVASLGTLGGGNHFIEVDKDETGAFWLVVHSGSRNFGLQIANYHQGKAKKLMREMFIDEDAYKTLEFLPMEHGGQGYLDDMAVAQNYALLNRKTMLDNLLRYYFKYTANDLPRVASVHNYISFNDNTIRKGAISANAGQEVIIPLNMRDGTIIGIGKGNEKWNNSAPHGAGRTHSRKSAKETFTMAEFEASMQGIFTTCVVPETLDESPMAYKDKDLILEAISETVEVKHILKPVYNFKAAEGKRKVKPAEIKT